MIESQIASGETGTTSANRLPPRATGVKKRDAPPQALSSQYRSQQENYCYTSSVDSGALQIEKRESQTMVKEENKQEDPLSRNDQNITAPVRSNNMSILANKKAVVRSYHAGALGAKQERGQT